MTASENCIKLIKTFEGLRTHAYQDSVGVWTIGYGHTRGVAAGQVITEAQAVEYLRADLESAELAVTKSVKTQISQNEFDALVAFTFNVGPAALAYSTLVHKLNMGDHKGAAAEFDRWNKAGGKVLAGLTRRRAAERALFEGQTT